MGLEGHAFWRTPRVFHLPIAKVLEPKRAARLLVGMGREGPHVFVEAVDG